MSGINQDQHIRHVPQISEYRLKVASCKHNVSHDLDHTVDEDSHWSAGSNSELIATMAPVPARVQNRCLKNN